MVRAAGEGPRLLVGGAGGEQPPPPAPATLPRRRPAVKAAVVSIESARNSTEFPCRVPLVPGRMTSPPPPRLPPPRHRPGHQHGPDPLRRTAPLRPRPPPPGHRRL